MGRTAAGSACTVAGGDGGRGRVRGLRTLASRSFRLLRLEHLVCDWRESGSRFSLAGPRAELAGFRHADGARAGLGGIFSIAFRDTQHGVIAGGDCQYPNDDGPNLAFTEDGGKTWKLSALKSLAYFSAVAFERSGDETVEKRARAVAPERIFIVGQDFMFDFRPPDNPQRIEGKKLGIGFNAASAYLEGGVLLVGPKGTVASIP